MDAEESRDGRGHGDERSNRINDEVEVETLDSLIEKERARLMRANSILGCACIALEYEEIDEAGAPSIPDVLEVVRELVSTTINKLDSINRNKLR